MSVNRLVVLLALLASTGCLYVAVGLDDTRSLPPAKTAETTVSVDDFRSCVFRLGVKHPIYEVRGLDWQAAGASMGVKVDYSLQDGLAAVRIHPMTYGQEYLKHVLDVCAESPGSEAPSQVDMHPITGVITWSYDTR